MVYMTVKSFLLLFGILIPVQGEILLNWWLSDANMMLVSMGSVTELLIYGILCLTLVSSSSVNVFKNNLDKFWRNQNFYYDYEAEPLGFHCT